MNLHQKEVKFMGHVISSDGLKPDPHKIIAIENMPKPRSKQELMSLLGFINYLAKFLPHLAQVSQPLRDLTMQNVQFVWSPIHNRAFTKVNHLVSKPSGAEVL